MALNFAILKQVAERMQPGARVAAMGYPDITATEEQMTGILKGREIEYRKDSDIICQRHGINPPRRIPDAESVFRALGAELHVFDIIQERGCEILCDLNKPLDQQNLYDATDSYDFVLDVGTMEHCFNVGQAMMNMASLVKLGGVIYHENPFVMPNHGFWSMNPTLYADFYEQNGFELIGCSAHMGRLGEDRVAEVPIKKRFGLKGPFETATLLAAAERKEIKPFVAPCQSKYKATLAAAGNRA